MSRKLSSTLVSEAVSVSIVTPPQNNHIYIYIPADASEIVYGPVAYFRFRDSSHKINCPLVIRKSKLSQIKEKDLTIPRLEVQVAVIATRIKHHIIEDALANVENVFFWSDCIFLVRCYAKLHSRN